MVTIVQPEITRTGVAESEGSRAALWVTANRKNAQRRLVYRSLEPPAPADRLLFGGSIQGPLRVIRPIDVTVRREDDLIVVNSDALSEFGSGRTLGDAMLDFGKSIAELYVGLERDRDRLGSDLAKLRALLHEHIAHR